MLRHQLIAGAMLALAWIPPGHAQESTIVGGDVYVSGSDAVLTSPAARDAFVSGFDAGVEAAVTGDAHVAGFHAYAEAPVSGDLYMSGFSAKIDATVGGDLSAAAARLDIDDDTKIEGNARILGGSVNIDGTISGSLIAMSGRLTLDGPVSGDVVITAGDLEFGDDAVIGGTLSYSAPEAVDIPASVISADRVTFETLRAPDAFSDMRKGWREDGFGFWPRWASVFSAFVLTLVFLVSLGALTMATAPGLLERLRRETIERSFSSLLFGLAGLAMLIGLVPVSIMTLIGIPLVPVVILLTVGCWIFGYLVGAYALSRRIAIAFLDIGDALTTRLATLATGLLVLALLNFIPFLGWLVNFAVLLLGIGAIMAVVVEATIKRGAGGDNKADEDSPDSAEEAKTSPS